MKAIDAKLVIWIVTVVFLAGGAWWSLQSVSTDVAEIKTSLDDTEGDLMIHAAADSHTGGDARITRIEATQTVLADDMKTLMTNQSAICQATGARCR
tara:strand:- start:144 stop:434 length:291 start_codon:yes stop_codon:yes gene_type:complete